MDYKALTDADLADIFLPLRRWKTPPKRHQLVTLAWAATKSHVSLWHGIGTGKSLTALYLHHHVWGTRRHLVVCPNSVVDSWDEQIRQHTDLRPILLQGSRDERRAALRSGPGVYVVNYEGLLPLFCQRVKGRARPDPSLAEAAGFDGVTADECHNLKSPTAIQTKVFRLLSAGADRAIIMTGTPISTSEADLWSEYRCLDGGRCLGTSRWKFLRKHFKQDFFGGWNVKPGQRDAILRRVAPATLRYDREECLDLPDRAYETRTVPMSAEQRRIHEAVAAGREFVVGGRTVGPLDPAQAAGKLSQVAGGFVLVDGEAVRLAQNPKLDEVGRTLDEIGGKIIIFHSFVEEGRMLEGLCRAKGIGFASLRGEVKNKAAQVAWFREGEECRVLIAHPASGGVGLNLQVASVAGFYSNGLTGALVRRQAEGRIYREGQRRPCLYIDWEVEGSLDARHLHRIEQQADVQQAALDFLRNWRP